MSQALTHEVTQLLTDWRNGDQNALDKLMPIVYDELRRLARHYMNRERPGHTLQTTALVNEAYLRLNGQKNMNIDWQNRSHFFGIAARVMRQILVDHARSHAYAKRGGGAIKVPLEDAAVVSEDQAGEFIALDEALVRLEDIDPRKCRVVELRYFGGLTVEETAEVLKVSPVTVLRDWSMAKTWLRREISNEA